MNINELYESIQDKFIEDDIHGEFLLFGNLIIWSYKITEENDEKNYLNDEDENEIYNFESMSSEELLQEAYQEDYENLQEFLDDIGEIDNWEFSNSEIIDNIITFKIF